MKDLTMIKKLLTLGIISISGIFSLTYACETSPFQYEELNHLYQVSHPDYPDHQIHLLPTHHWNSEITEEIVNFIGNNCGTIYYESALENNIYKVNDYDKEVYKRYLNRKDMGLPFPSFGEYQSFPQAFESLKIKISSVENSEMSIISEFEKEDINFSDDETNVTQNDLSNLIREAEDSELTAQYLAFGDQSIAFENTLKDIKKEFDTKEELDNANRFLESFKIKDQIKETELKKNSAYYLDPTDLITETLFSSGIKGMMKWGCKNLDKTLKIGTEEDLKEKLKRKLADISFAYLETEADIRRGLREAVLEHTSEDDPYTKWIQAFEEIKSVSGKSSLEEALIEDGNLSKKLPTFLKQIYHDALFSKRESRWLFPMKDVFMKSKGQKGNVFAVGSVHIPNLIEKLGKEGYETRRII